MWARAGSYNGFWCIPCLDKQAPGILKITKRGRVTVDLLLDDDQKSALLFALRNGSLSYSTIVGSLDARSVRNPVVSLINVAAHLGSGRLYADKILFGIDILASPDPKFTGIACSLGDLGNWPLISEQRPISVPMGSVVQGIDHDVRIRMPLVVSGSGVVPSIGLSPRADFRSWTDLRYRFVPMLRWELEAPLSLSECIVLVHRWHSFVILLTDSIVEINDVSLEIIEDSPVQLVYEPLPVGRRRRERRPLTELRVMADDFVRISKAWDCLHQSVPEAIAVAVQFHYAKYYDAGQLFELVTALESLHEKRHKGTGFIAKDKFREIKRTLKEQWRDDAHALQLFEERLENYPSLRTRLDGLTAPLEHRNIVTAEQRGAFIDNLVKARNDFGHRLAAPQGSRELFRLVNQTHIVLKALLLNELGLLDLAWNRLKRQWDSWEHW